MFIFIRGWVTPHPPVSANPHTVSYATARPYQGDRSSFWAFTGMNLPSHKQRVGDIPIGDPISFISAF